MHSAETALIPGLVITRVPSQWTRLLPTGLPGAPGLDAGHPRPLTLAAPEQDFPLISAREEQTGSKELVPNPSWAGSCDRGWQGTQENRDAPDRGRKLG